MTNPRFFLSNSLIGLLGFALIAFSGCGKGEDLEKEGSAPALRQAVVLEDRTASDGATSEPLATFEPALLLSAKQTAEFTVEIPEQPKDAEEPRAVIRVLLDSPTPYVLTARLAAECATRRGQKELAARLPEMKAAIVEHISGKTPTFVASPAGRAKLREEILQILQGQMRNKTIKQVYFIQYFVSPGKV